MEISVGKLKANIIGGDNQVVVWDETIMGLHKGVNTRTDRHRTSFGSKADRRSRVAERLPSRTVFKSERRQEGSFTLLKKPGAVQGAKEKSLR